MAGRLGTLARGRARPTGHEGGRTHGGDPRDRPARPAVGVGRMRASVDGRTMPPGGPCSGGPMMAPSGAGSPSRSPGALYPAERVALSPFPVDGTLRRRMQTSGDVGTPTPTRAACAWTTGRASSTALAPVADVPASSSGSLPRWSDDHAHRRGRAVLWSAALDPPSRSARAHVGGLEAVVLPKIAATTKMVGTLLARGSSGGASARRCSPGCHQPGPAGGVRRRRGRPGRRRVVAAATGTPTRCTWNDPPTQDDDPLDGTGRMGQSAAHAVRTNVFRASCSRAASAPRSGTGSGSIDGLAPTQVVLVATGVDVMHCATATSSPTS